MNYLCGKQCWGFFCLGRAGSEKGNVSSELHKSEKKRLVGFGQPSFHTVWVQQGLMKLILWVNILNKIQKNVKIYNYYK